MTPEQKADGTLHRRISSRCMLWVHEWKKHGFSIYKPPSLAEAYEAGYRQAIKDNPQPRNPS